MQTRSSTPEVLVVWGDPAQRRFDIAFVGAGFRDGETSAYEAEVRALSRELLSTQPFARLRRLVNVYRVDPDPGTPHELVPSVSLDDQRLVTVDEDVATSIARTSIPSVDLVVVLVNTTEYGGSAGRVAVTTRHPRGAALLVHEIGHAGFDLADEYGQGGERHPGPEPRRVNVTVEPDPARSKWADLVDATGAVGCFEGGDRHDHGVYRPQSTCRMRSLNSPFCVVCSRAITRTLLAHRRDVAVQSCSSPV